MDNQTNLRFTAHNRSETSVEEVFTVRELKEKYPKLWLKSQRDYQVFINLCLERWVKDKEDLVFNVVTYSVDSDRMVSNI